MELSEIEKEVLKQLRTNEKIKYVCDVHIFLMVYIQ